jgi:ribosome-binding protein aMBF1 (putative translation factor)
MKDKEQKIAKEFGSFMRVERKKNALTQVELAKIMDMSQSRLSKVEQGQLILNVFEFFSFAKVIGLKSLERFISK